MAEIRSKLEAVVVHYKGDEPVAITHSNSHQTLYKLDGAMNRGEIEEFYEVEKSLGPAQK